jgi:hypothetical protein
MPFRFRIIFTWTIKSYPKHANTSVKNNPHHVQAHHRARRPYRIASTGAKLGLISIFIIVIHLKNSIRPFTIQAGWVVDSKDQVFRMPWLQGLTNHLRSTAQSVKSSDPSQAMQRDLKHALAPERYDGTSRHHPQPHPEKLHLDRTAGKIPCRDGSD